MGFDPLGALFSLGESLINKLLPDPTAKAAAIQRLAELKQSGELAVLAAETDLIKGQLDINKVEAASPLTFVSGGRPFVIWVCGSGLAVQFVIGPLIAWGSALFEHPIVPPSLDMSAMMPLLFGLLGVGTMRTIEKLNDKASK
jgi:hypothetical protein